MIFETIITTQASDGRIHIAPMGIREDNGLIVLAPFRPSTTLDNVLGNSHAAVNYCDDVRIFAGCLTGRRDWPTVPADKVPCVRLESALTHCELKLERIEEDELRPRLLCQVVHRVSHSPFRGFNRAQAAVLEAAILVSRLHLLPREKIDAEVKYLAIAIDKTAGPREREAWSWLMEKIEAHRASPKQGSTA
ncbi:MAG TPA: DUF447 domain-containing protein [Burkholderiales bacterium]|nr:DUF447 domain-containing protein [Burkholderiales bacterium]